MHGSMKTLRSVLAAAFALGLSLQAAAGPPPSKATKAEFDKAQGLFEKAKAQLQKGKLDDALAGFHRSYSVVASPISRLFAARCLAALGRELDAHRELTEVVFEARSEAQKDPKYDETRQAAESERAELASKVAVVAVRVDPSLGGDVTIGGVARPRERLADGWAVPAGSVEVALSTPGKRDARTVTVALGERRDVTFGKAEAPAAAAPVVTAVDDGAARRRKLRLGGWVAGAVGVVGLGVFAVEGSRARSRYNDLKDECGGGPCPADRASDVSAGRRDATIANVGLAVGAIGVGAGVTMLVLGRDPKPGEARGPTVSVAGGPGSISIRGSFR